MIIPHRHESSYLADKLLGDPGERDLFVYLPPGYEESDRRFATEYLLHAFGETNEGMVTHRRIPRLACIGHERRDR